MSNLKSARILVLEDDHALRSVLRDFLSLMYYQVIEAEDIASFRQLSSEHSVDLLLLDLNLPDGDGLNLLRELACEQGHLYSWCPGAVTSIVGCRHWRPGPTTISSNLSTHASWSSAFVIFFAGNENGLAPSCVEPDRHYALATGICCRTSTALADCGVTLSMSLAASGIFFRSCSVLRETCAVADNWPVQSPLPPTPPAKKP